MANKTALVIGATGLVGAETLQQLLVSSNYAKVIALTRRPVGIKNAKLENLVVDFDKPEQYAFVKCDDVYCAMGTTIGKAGSREAFHKSDVEIPLQVAETALKNGASKFMLVSSAGANAKSLIFYSRCKGELERAVMKMSYKAVLIFRPSILLGNRQEHRAGEEAGKFVAEKLSFIFAGPLRKYRGTPAGVLAAAMINAANSGLTAAHIIENNEIFELANKQNE